MFGAHLSIAGGLHNALLKAEALQCDTVQVFTNPNTAMDGRCVTLKYARTVAVPVFCLWFLFGCAAKQDYQMLRPASSDQSLLDKKFVADGHVVRAVTTGEGSLFQKVFFFLPILTVHHIRYDATIALDVVLKGNDPARVLELRNYRPLTDDERNLLPNPHGIMGGGTRFRLGYDGRRGERLTGLKLIPIGNTAELDASLRQAAQLERERAEPSRKQ